MMDNRKRAPVIVISNDVLDDLCSRFLLNIPGPEKDDMVRLCFQIELAHWFYLDFYRTENQDLPDCRVRDFAKIIFENYPFLLKPTGANIDEVIDRWREYKRSVPTYGAVILDETMDHVLLVQGFVVKSSWGFPKGKVNKNEKAEDCAAREVLEETGFDIKPYMNTTEYVEQRFNEQLTRLYYVVGVPCMTKFSPKTRGEIKSVEWFNMDDLPCHKKDMTPKQNLSMAPNNFFMVIPFVAKIRKWIAGQRNRFQKTQKSSKPSTPVKKIHHSGSNHKLEGLSKAQFEHLSSTNPLPVVNKKEDSLREAERQRQYFARENNLQLEKILRIKSGKSSPQPQKIQPRNRSNSPHHKLSSPVGYSYVSNRGRGRILYSEAMPECWKNFQFDLASLQKVIDEFTP
uniref:m7GpppN-mRNA hydrolase-like n=1 Tax=Styela clava TaxID=7725 RepID=UPI00193947E6|nr:m7GpppN-mRNA hydrolase-like [Styela clava]